MCGGGVKTNVIPDVVNVEVDIRTVPGDSEDEVRRHLDKAVGGDLMEDVEIEKLFSKPASASPTGTPLWDVLGRVVGAHYPGARLLPRMIVGFTDAPILEYPRWGTVARVSDSILAYTAKNGFVGTDRFKYQITDSEGRKGSAYVTITVTQVTETPVAAAESA